jgi:hypothetical protein
VTPWVIVAVAIFARFSMHKRPSLSASLMLSIPLAWIAASVASTFVFPITFRVLWVGPFLIGVIMLALWLLSTRSMVRWRSATPFVVVIFATALGLATPMSQRAGASATRPLNVPMPAIDSMPAPQDQRAIRLSPGVQVQPGSALISFTNGRCLLGVQPVLDFASRSPDGCWTLFASPRQRESPPRRFVGITQQESSIDLAYENNLRSLLHVSVDSPAQTHIESVTRVPFDIYSHLNTFCELTMTGHKRLSILFSPCPQSPIEVTYMEYPRGRPERMAYLDAAGAFHVVEASSAEKGPYHELAHGTLGAHDALTMTLLDEDRPVFRLTFDDWAAQSSTALSPTAGYGLPENAIEFSLEGAAPTSAAGIYVTLAATSAGRGYNSVGHTRGTYRNQMLVEMISRER